MSAKELKLPKNVPKVVPILKDGQIIQFDLESKKKSMLKESDIFVANENKDESARLKRVVEISKIKRDKLINSKNSKKKG